MSTWAVVPVKAFERAKSRLEPALGRAGCTELARELFDHVLGVLLATPALGGVLVVSDSDAVIARARERGAAGMRDRVTGVLGRVVDDALVGVDATRALVVMSDLPLLSREDVALLLGSRARVVVAPDQRGEGTNALVLPVPAPWPTCFGTPDSALGHQRVAGDAAVVRAPGLALDIDDATDLARWPGRPGAPVAGRAGPA